MSIQTRITALAQRVAQQFNGLDTNGVGNASGVVGTSSTDALDKLNQHIIELSMFTEVVGGQYLLDPNEFNGPGVIGLIDQSHTQDLSNVGATAITRNAGGFVFPYDVKLLGFKADHKNNNAAAQAWGWRFGTQDKLAVDDGNVNNTKIDEIIYRECVGVGATAIAPRDYGSNGSAETNIDFEAVTGGEVIITADKVFNFGIEAPTADGTNRFVQVMAGYFFFQRGLTP